MEVVLAAKEENFVPAAILLHTDRTHVLFPCLLHRAGVQTGHIVVFDTSRIEFIKHFFIKDGLESFGIHSLNGRLVSARITIHYRLPFVFPVDEIQVVLAVLIHFYRRLLVYPLLLRWVGLLELTHSRLWAMLTSFLLCSLLLFKGEWVRCLSEYFLVVVGSFVMRRWDTPLGLLQRYWLLLSLC